MTPAAFVSGGAPLELALRGTLLLGAAWLAAVALRRTGASAATRHMAWLLCIAALLALPLLWWSMPPLQLPVLAPEAASAAGAALAPAFDPVPPAAAAAPGWGNALVVVYLLGLAALLLRFTFSRRLVSGLWRDAEPARDAVWQDMLSGAALKMRISRPVELRIARGPVMPMTWGTLAPRMLLPAEAHLWSSERRRLVLLHELAHVARRDSLTRSAASLVCALYWFHPGAWFAARQLRLEQEYAADDRVLNAGAQARSYARNLLDLALRVGERAWPDHAAAMAGTCQLERRVVAITTPGAREQSGPAFLSASVAIATCVMLAVSTGVPVRPLPGLPDPLEIQAAADGRVIPAPAEESSGESVQAPDRVTVTARATDRPRNISGGGQTQRTASPLSQAEGPAGATAGQPVEPAAQVNAGAPLSGAVLQDAPPPPQRLAAYGPQLPQPIPAEQESDPRIPAALRGHSARGASAGREGRQPAARSRASSLLRFLPRLGLEASGVLPPGR